MTQYHVIQRERKRPKNPVTLYSSFMDASPELVLSLPKVSV